jgi:hypothetical protein
MKHAFWILLFFTTACSKKNATDKDYDAPVIVLNTPVDNQVYAASQNIAINGTVTDNKYIQQLHIVISNLTTGEEYLHVHIHPASPTFTFNQSFTPTHGVSYKVQVIADDPSANTFGKSVEVSCN